MNVLMFMFGIAVGGVSAATAMELHWQRTFAAYKRRQADRWNRTFLTLDYMERNEK